MSNGIIMGAGVTPDMSERRSDVIKGTLDMLILRVLNQSSLHGWGIAQRIHMLSSDALKVEEGSLYPALSRLERKGLIKSKWGVSELNRRAKFYRLTRSGLKHYQKERAKWIGLTKATALVLGYKIS